MNSLYLFPAKPEVIPLKHKKWSKMRQACFHQKSIMILEMLSGSLIQLHISKHRPWVWLIFCCLFCPCLTIVWVPHYASQASDSVDTYTWTEPYLAPDTEHEELKCGLVFIVPIPNSWYCAPFLLHLLYALSMLGCLSDITTLDMTQMQIQEPDSLVLRKCIITKGQAKGKSRADRGS